MDETFRFLSEPEKKVWKWLTKNDIPFTTQKKMWGGTSELGGAVIDFLVESMNLAIRVMGTYWHEGLVPDARDTLGKEMLAAAGYAVVDVWEDNLETPEEVEYTMKLALQGLEVPR